MAKKYVLDKRQPHLAKAQLPRHWFIHKEALVKQLVDNWKLVWPEDLVSGCWNILVLDKISKIDIRLMLSECDRTLDFLSSLTECFSCPF